MSYKVSSDSRVASARGTRTTTSIQSTSAMQSPAVKGTTTRKTYKITGSLPQWNSDMYDVAEVPFGSESQKLQAAGKLPTFDIQRGTFEINGRSATQADYAKYQFKARPDGWYADLEETSPDVPGEVKPGKIKYNREALAIKKEGKQDLIADEDKPESLTAEDVLKRRLAMIRMRGRASMPSSDSGESDEPTINISSGGTMGLNFA
jgi:hypothetical protein